MLKSIKILCAALAIVFLAACQSTNNHAAIEPAFTPEQVTIPEYLDFLSDLDASIQEGEPRQLSDRELAQFENVRMNLTTLIGEREHLDEFSQSEKERLFNLHQRLQVVVIGNPERQVICRQERTVGSNMRQTRCVTQAERDAEQRRSTEFMGDLILQGRGSSAGGN